VTDPSSVNVVIAHPFGDIEIPLEEWMTTGPGPRLLVRPIAAKDRKTGERLPLDVIPLEYRNDEQSIELIVRGDLTDPWGRNLEELKRALEDIMRSGRLLGTA
jgi:hypothetical protein